MRHRSISGWNRSLRFAAFVIMSAIAWTPSVAQAATVLHFDFNETGNAPGSTGTDARPIKMRDDDGGNVDLHSAHAGGVSGLPGDRSFANTGPSDQGRFASGNTNGFRAHQSDNPAVDGFVAFTLSGWFKTELADTFLPDATPRLVNNHDGDIGSSGDGFNLQFLTNSEGDLKLEVDDDTGGGVSTTGAPYSAKQKWVFFAVSYDGAAVINNVNFYIGFRNDAEAGGGPGSAAVALVTTASLNRGAVDAEGTALRLANRNGNDRPFKGYLDEIRIDDVAHAGPAGLAALENYRELALAPPLDAEFRFVSEVSIATAAPDQHANAVLVNELSGVTYNADTDRFWAVSDETPGRLLEIDVAFDPNGAIVSATAISALTLDDSLDFESIEYTDPQRNSVFLANEDPPGVREYRLTDGSLLQNLAVPPVFANHLANRGFESLSRSHDGTEMWAGIEQALTVDGAAGTSTTIGTVSRWLRYDVAGNTVNPAEQVAYRVEPVHDTPVGGDGSSLTELAELADGSLLAMERSIADGEILVRVFRATTENATDVSQGVLGNGLLGESYTLAHKTLLFSDNGFGKLEGLAVGPVLASGKLVLLGVEDDNENESVIRSFVLTGDFDAPPEFPPWPLGRRAR